MLTEMRSLSQNWFGRAIMAVVLAFIILSFAVWGIGDRFTNFNANELARVGSAHISADDYRAAYQTDLRRLERQQKRGITNEEAKRLGIDRQVLSRLLTDALLDQQAAKLGLAVGNDELVRNIVKDPAFAGPDGKFDQQQFVRLLSENGFSEASYAKSQRNLTLRQDVANAVVGGLALPDAMAGAIHRFQSEVRDFDFFVLPTTAAGVIPPPSPADLQGYYDAHAGAFVAPEYRKIAVLSVLPTDLAKPADVSDADVQKQYDDVKAARFTEPEKRTVEQLVFPSADAAAAAQAKLAGGESFAQLAADEKKSPADISLGTVAKSGLADPAVAGAAFSLPAEGTSGPIKGEFGIVLVHVTAITPERQKPLAEVASLLKGEIAMTRARQQATKLRDTIEDARNAGKTLAEAAAATGLKVRTVDAVDAQGRDKAGKPVEALPAGPQLLKAAFGTDVGADTESLSTADGGSVWYEVAGIDPARKLSLVEVKDRVEAGWREGEIARRLVTEGDGIVKAVDGGQSLAAAAQAHGNLPVLKATNIGRGGGPGLPQPVAAAFFNTVVGKAGSVTDGEQGRIVFKIEAAHVPPLSKDDPQLSKLLAQVKSTFEDDVLAQYLARVQGEIGVSINQQALQTALGGNDS